MPVSVQNKLSELDTLLANLSNARYAGQTGQRDSADQASRSVISTAYAYGDYYSDLEYNVGRDKPPTRPPHPNNYAPENSTKSLFEQSISLKSTLFTSKLDGINHAVPAAMNGEKKVHNNSKKGRDDAPADVDETDDGADYDYSSKWDYLGKGIWENQDYGSVSNYSTLRTGNQEEYDYASLSRSGFVSEEELEKETGAGPRGDRSKVIETENGEVQSKYRYMGFGLWENTDPTAPKKRRKLRPPPPPPKASPIMYNCTVSVSKSFSSKELDDLVFEDNFGNMKSRRVEVAAGVGAFIKDPYNMFEKEDMSDMFKRAMLEKMQLIDKPLAKFKCYVCANMIQDRIITAMGNKFHPHCFVCTYCRKEFKDRKYKTDPRDFKPYCFGCFEKLLGHYGNAHG